MVYSRRLTMIARAGDPKSRRRFLQLLKGDAVIDADQDLHVPLDVVVRNGKMFDIPRIPD